MSYEIFAICKMSRWCLQSYDFSLDPASNQDNVPLSPSPSSLIIFSDPKRASNLLHIELYISTKFMIQRCGLHLFDHHSHLIIWCCFSSIQNNFVDLTFNLHNLLFWWLEICAITHRLWYLPVRSQPYNYYFQTNNHLNLSRVKLSSAKPDDFHHLRRLWISFCCIDYTLLKSSLASSKYFLLLMYDILLLSIIH